MSPVDSDIRYVYTYVSSVLQLVDSVREDRDVKESGPVTLGCKSYV
jgi:hypothetical protein